MGEGIRGTRTDVMVARAEDVEIGTTNNAKMTAVTRVDVAIGATEGTIVVAGVAAVIIETTEKEVAGTAVAVDEVTVMVVGKAVDPSEGAIVTTTSGSKLTLILTTQRKTRSQGKM